MARLARVVAVGRPYHVTHRGNQRREVFFSDEQRRLYLSDLGVWAHDCGLRLWRWCLMTNHVHLLVVPEHANSLARVMGNVHQRHARRVHAGQGVTGHLWANRFHSMVLDEAHLWAAVRYIELNPVRAGLAARPEEWAWSSARVHAGMGGALGADWLDPRRPFAEGARDGLTGRPMAWAEWLVRGMADESEAAAWARIRAATQTGRPCGGEHFAHALEAELGRPLEQRRRGPKPRPRDDEAQIELF